MTMQNPEDKIFKTLLSDYAAPVEDEGFTQSLMLSIEKSERHAPKWRRGVIAGAWAIGGLIAAIQLPALFDLVGQGLSPDLTIMRGFEQPSWMMAVIIFIGFLLMCAMDQKTSELF